MFVCQQKRKNPCAISSLLSHVHLVNGQIYHQICEYGGCDFLEIPPLSEKVLEEIFSSLLMTFFFFQTQMAPTQIQPTVSYFHLRIAMDWIRLSFTSSIVSMPYTVTTVTAQHLVGDTTFTSPTMQVRTQTLTQTWVTIMCSWLATSTVIVTRKIF